MSRTKSWVLILVLLVSGGFLKGSTEPIYDEKADAQRDISAAIANARKAKKNIVLIFGANWCPDCHALDAQMHNAELAALLAQNFEIVKVDIGRHNKNLDLAKQYKVPIQHGIPALAVLDSGGHLLYAMDQGQFADARNMSYESIKAFFEQWRPKN
ncbi:MAG: thioredoxin family protein [Terriglobia bacterium]|jgi:protein disulfide-isomerase